jgi:hypothetical protein
LPPFASGVPGCIRSFWSAARWQAAPWLGFPKGDENGSLILVLTIYSAEACLGAGWASEMQPRAGLHRLKKT